MALFQLSYTINCFYSNRSVNFAGASSSQAQSQSMAPPQAPAKPPPPMFVPVPPRTQRVLHSEAYLKYVCYILPLLPLKKKKKTLRWSHHFKTNSETIEILKGCK